MDQAESAASDRIEEICAGQLVLKTDSTPQEQFF